ncbi:DUF2388 domain-containing protein [Vulcaniibacterium tengchongense]|uniref:Uncharacterized protein (TIGR02448 family) n=1 Tax=Vulcaniibacterium tengchongense TaxID=1273429 RepID=A0A3N4VG41_9GAMM|nr:DUF2388 domain-containing protein [Vulcaniibacterium tengchongense]RPE81992.1 uncharacterized protein (TIGR02448 family) [Vulcaniibacterium tengchongense]
MNRTLLPLCAVLLTAFAPAALASSFAGTSAGTSAGGSSASSDASSDSSGDDEDKIVLAARDDAASFVASDGAIRGARLEAALRTLRERDAEARQASDLELARAILAL